MRISLLITGWLALLLVISLSACGTQNVGTLSDIAAHQVNGVQLAGYEVIRYNANGTADPTLNGTLDLRLEGQDLVVAVHDNVFTSSVLLDIKYNAGSVHPVKADFHGLLGNDTQVLSAAFIDQTAGLAGVGETAIGDYKPGPLNGDAVTVHFAPGALHTVSAAGTPYTSPLGVATKFEHTAYTPGIDNFTKNDVTPGEAHATWYCGWMRADGTQDGLCNIGDLTLIGVHFGKVIDNTDAMFAAAIADYDDNGQVGIGDLTPLGANFNKGNEQYTLEGSDNVDGAPMTAVSVLLQSAATPKGTTVTYPDLSTIMKSWTIDFTDASTFTYAALAALDTNTDQHVRLWVTPGYSGPPATPGTPAYVDITVQSGTPVVITGYDIQAVGATGGTGAGSDVFATGGSGSVVSNAALTLTLNSVSGTWAGAAFDGTTLPAGMTAANYDTIKTAVAAAMNWTFTNDGVAAARFTGPWYVSDNAGYLGVGDPGAGKVCPDDDPESTSASPEGGCATNLVNPITSADPSISITVGAPLPGAFTFDMTPDPVAPLIEGYYTGPDYGTKVTELQTGAGVTTVFLKMTSWGTSGTTIPADGTVTSVEVREVVGKDASAAPYILTWDAAQDPAVGKFTFFHAPAPLDIDIFICKIAGITLAPGSSFAIRFNDGAIPATTDTWSSINLPDGLLTTVPPPPPEDLLTLPKVYSRTFGAPHQLQIFRNEPSVRRDGRFALNAIAGTATPVDAAGYADILKDPSPMSEFPVSMKPVDIGGHPGFRPYPQIVIKEGTDASGFLEDDADAIPNISIPMTGGREGGRLNVDIAFLILSLPPAAPGDPDINYCYKVFGQTSDVGTGKFSVPSTPFDPTTPVGVAWGINVGERGTWLKNDFNGLCINTNVNGDTMTTPTPDVFWVRFNGNTRVRNAFEYWDGGSDDNVKIIFSDTTNPAQEVTGLYLSLVGITGANDYIAIHHLNRNDGLSYVDWVASFANGGVLQPGDVYDVQLDDPTTGGVDYTFAQQMTVSGANPNFP